VLQRANKYSTALFMSATTEHVTVRLPFDLVAELREQAKRDRRSLAFTMAERMGYWAEIDSGLRQALASADRRGRKAAPQRVTVASPAPAHQVSGCPSCGGLHGMHQRGCSQQRR
jgi:hypothetical protein